MCVDMYVCVWICVYVWICMHMYIHMLMMMMLMMMMPPTEPFDAAFVGIYSLSPFLERVRPAHKDWSGSTDGNEQKKTLLRVVV